jgi:hypothetical protein
MKRFVEGDDRKQFALLRECVDDYIEQDNPVRIVDVFVDELHVRPIYHFSESRVRAHMFLCMLAYYVEWHLREALKPLLHDDEDLTTRRDQRANPVMPTPRSEGAYAKAARHRTDDALPAHSLHTLLQDLATLTYNITSTPVNPQAKIVITTRPTPLQSKAFALLGINPACSQ